MAAAKHGHDDTLMWLKNRGADMDVTDNRGRSLLHYAVESGQTDVMRWLLNKDNQLDVNAEDNSKQTPLHYAAKQGLHSAAVILIRAGANVDAADSVIQTPLHLAVRLPENGFSEIMEYHAPMTLGHVDTVFSLLSAGANINARDKFGHTALSRAIEYGDTRVAKVLLKNKAEINQKL